ncbi:helix-turn-helix domain-containing protein [Nonomuraea turcica]|uniref:helix-turn-helix domain-containing protein n=1 Tax=Nonomuraea sp. G32 TaxID=3067274 RepID=UPI00273B8BBF|nr:helix-turn-helix transcriptional regulator [Nonomuraea sp. G32]MDP4508016.1 helix-turn-helix transcriptional regulator [Nonomuraea sp. G32]
MLLVMCWVGPALPQSRDLASFLAVPARETLSRLESGQRRAGLELLLPLARAYDVPLDDLVGAPRTGDPRIHLAPIHRFGMTFVPLPHWLGSADGRAVELLILFGQQGQRAHLRVRTS